MPEYHVSLKDLDMPVRIKRLPVDHRGFPVPKFVAWPNGEADHRVVNLDRFTPSVKQRLCWICGEPMGRYYVNIIGCMCAVNRVISEPPSHLDCAEFSVKACPFLSRPQAHRRDIGLPEGIQEQPGMPIKRNPGVACLWISKSYPKLFKTQMGNAGVLFSLGEPIETIWYREGRLATRREVIDAIHEGLPTLEAMAAQEGKGAPEALNRQLLAAWTLLPYGDENPADRPVIAA
jgi:hypothetical protein